MTWVSLRSERCPYSCYLDSSWFLFLTSCFNRSSNPAVKIWQLCLWNWHLGCEIGTVNPSAALWCLGMPPLHGVWESIEAYPETSSISAVLLMVVIVSSLLSLFSLDFRLQIWVGLSVLIHEVFLPLWELSFWDNSMGFAVIFGLFYAIVGVCPPKPHQVVCW